MGLCLTGKPEDVADVIIFTQDTLNVQYIAREVLQDAYCYNEIRNTHGYTGTYRGHRVSVQGTGIGPVSAAMYATEIANEFGTKCMIKLDGCKAITDRVKPGDLLLAQTAHTTAKINRLRFNGRTFPAAADFELLNRAYELAKAEQRPVWAGPVLSIESRDELAVVPKFAAYGTLGLDMELNQVYTAAARFHLPAVGILSVFENTVTGESLSETQRKEQFQSLVDFALRAVFEE